jgi:DNA-binding NarL/FixJ family response regulator
LLWKTNTGRSRRRLSRLSRTPVLTRRQLQIARLIADDLTNRQIAARLFLSERTVETHITNILNKLGLNSGIQNQPLDDWHNRARADRR